MASTSSGFRLLDDQNNNNFDTISSISRNSIYKQKIDLMFDDSRYVIERGGDQKRIFYVPRNAFYAFALSHHFKINYFNCN